MEVGDVVWKSTFLEPVDLGEDGRCVQAGTWEGLERMEVDIVGADEDGIGDGAHHDDLE